MKAIEQYSGRCSLVNWLNQTRRNLTIKFLNLNFVSTPKLTLLYSFYHFMQKKVKFLYRKDRYLTKELGRMLWNTLIQPHFDYACPAWYPNLNEKTKTKIQIMQNEYVRFCLKLDKIHHISEEDFKSINWLPTAKRVDQCINTITYNFVDNTCPFYLNEIFEFAPHCSISTRNNFSKLSKSFSQNKHGTKRYFLNWSLYLEQLAWLN